MCSNARIFACSLSLLCGAGLGSASAVEPSGTTIAVVQSAAVAGAAGRRVLEVQGPVFMGDRVQTGSVGEAQIEFWDNTRLVVGPNSLLTIDSFVFDENNTARKISMNAVKGAFRFITGKSRKQAYSIATPSATLGIRGTRFDLAVRANGETTLALLEGEARLCDRAQRCMLIRGGCAVVVVPPGGGIQPVRAGPQRSARLSALFPFIVSQARLQPQFRAETSSCGLRSAALDPRSDLIENAPSAPALEGTPGNSFANAPETPSISEPGPTPSGPSQPEQGPPSGPGPVADSSPGFGHGDQNHDHSGPPGPDGQGPPGLGGDGPPGQEGSRGRGPDGNGPPGLQ